MSNIKIRLKVAKGVIFQGKEQIERRDNEMTEDADVVVVGGGIIGTAVLSALTRYELHCVLVEKEPDIAVGTTKANSGILHSGLDAPNGSNKARMNVWGNWRYHELEKELALDILWTGSLVVALTAEDEIKLRELKARGEANGVLGLEIWDGDQVRCKEPNLNPAIRAGLWAPTAGICWPFQIAAAFAENAVQNGAEIWRSCPVLGIQTEGGRVTAVDTARGSIRTRFVVNAAGIEADRISAMAGDDSFTIQPRKGEYILFDRGAQEKMVRSIVFPTPTEKSKGIVACATVHGNVFVGPNAHEVEDREDLSVTAAGMEEVLAGARKLLPDLPCELAITEFAGLRAVASTDDFILGASPMVKGLVQAAGIQSPGLTSAPAIGDCLAALIARESGAARRRNYRSGRPPESVFRTLAPAEQAALIAKDRRYGRVICRCETITEGEIVDAIRRPCGARTVDGVKRRTRAGMGRCQGGFCGPRVISILAREMGISVSEIQKDGMASYLYYDKAGGAMDVSEL